MKDKVLYVVTFIFGISSYAQVPTVEWQNYYSGSSFDTVYDQKQTSDGGYILTGSTMSPETPSYHYGQDVLIMKISNLGVIEWKKAIGGVMGDSGASIIQTADGGYILCGESSSVDGDFNLTTNHGDFDLFLLKLDNNGNVLWYRNYGGSASESAIKVIQVSDGGYMMLCSTTSTDGDITLNHGNFDSWLIKVSSLGIIEWQKTYGGYNYDQMNDIIATSDGGYIMVGESNTGSFPGYHGGTDFLVIKIDNSGNVAWQKFFGGTGWDWGNAVVQTPSGDYVIGGSSQSINGDLTSNHGGFFDFWIIKISSAGTLLWQKTYGGPGGEQITDILQTSDGGYVACGISDSVSGDVTNNYGGNDFWVIKVSQNGILVWQKSVGTGIHENANCLMQSSDGGFLVSGGTAQGMATSDAFVVKLSSNLATYEYLSEIGISLYPNPSADFFSINNPEIKQLTIFTLEGKPIKYFGLQDKYSVDGLSSGNYLVKAINNDNEVQTFKLVKL